MNIGYTRSKSVNAMEARKKTSFFGKWITDESEYKKLQPTALDAANLAGELQEPELNYNIYGSYYTLDRGQCSASRRLQSVDPI